MMKNQKLKSIAFAGSLGLVSVLAGGEAAAVATAEPVLGAELIAITGGSSPTNSDQSVGWEFDVTEQIVVGGLGWYDAGLDGLSHAHDIGIWHPDGSFIGGGEVPIGTQGDLVGRFRVVEITPLILPVGSGYIVGGVNFDDTGDPILNQVTVEYDPRINFVASTFSGFSSTLIRPGSHSSNPVDGFFGPNFVIVPEPSVALLFACSGLGLLTRRRKNA